MEASPTMLGGYAGKLLRVDLTTQSIREETLDEAYLRKWIGGSGIGTQVLASETGPSTDPLGPDNVFVVSVGPLTGGPAPTSCRHEVTTKSPLTGIFGESDCGGVFGGELKQAGYDALVVTGASPHPVYLWVSDGRTELRSADDLWGQDAYATDAAIKTATDARAAVMSIGQAGERLARVAAVMHDGANGRAAGRTGVGAVMGSKRLKGIAVRGTGRVTLADATALRDSIRAVVPSVIENTPSFQNFGTAGSVQAFEQSGNLPLQNWRAGSWPEGAALVSGQHMSETILSGRYRCRTCVIGCGREVVIDRGQSAGEKIGGPEYETIGSLGSMCLVDDLTAISVANDLCNRYGLDTISVGGIVAFAMECYERGLLSKADFDGVEPLWGSGSAMIELVRKIGEREGIGQLLGEGTRLASHQIGRGSDRFAMQVKGLELPMHDPRAFHSDAVAYATSNRGACHLQALSHAAEARLAMVDLGYDHVLDRLADSGKGEMVAKMQNLMSVMDSLKLCKFILFGKLRIPTMADWLSFTTGWKVEQDELLETGERIFNAKRQYNVALGVTSVEDSLPERILREPRPEGGSAGSLPDLDLQKREYYAYRGWTPAGAPTPEKLATLGL